MDASARAAVIEKLGSGDAVIVAVDHGAEWWVRRVATTLDETLCYLASCKMLDGTYRRDLAETPEGAAEMARAWAADRDTPRRS